MCFKNCCYFLGINCMLLVLDLKVQENFMKIMIEKFCLKVCKEKCNLNCLFICCECNLFDFGGIKSINVY